MIYTLTETKNSSPVNISNNFRFTLLRLILLTFLLIWVMGFMYPTLITQNNSLTNYFLSRIYSPVCHQQSSKCLTIANQSMLVCARCTGIYLGALFVGLFILIYKIPKLRIKMLFITFLLLILDVFFVTFGVYQYSKFLALFTGLFFGAVVYLILINELENFFTTKSIKRNE